MSVNIKDEALRILSFFFSGLVVHIITSKCKILIVFLNLGIRPNKWRKYCILFFPLLQPVLKTIWLKNLVFKLYLDKILAECSSN